MMEDFTVLHLCRLLYVVFFVFRDQRVGILRDQNLRL